MKRIISVLVNKQSSIDSIEKNLKRLAVNSSVLRFTRRN